MDGVIDVRSLTRGPEDLEDVGESPFWSRLLLAPDRSASFVVLRIGNDDDHAGTVSAIDRILERHSADGFVLGASGVPYVAEHIRRQLTEELRRLSIAAFAAFAVLIAVLFRSPAIVVGSMVAALTASFGTFLVRALAGMRTDILAPNLWTIAFVLTISHIVYLTAQWRRQAREAGAGDAVSTAIRLVGPVSAWSLAANLLGFATLLFVSAKPLRQFGLSGMIAAVLAIVCAYGLYPAFLRAAGPGRQRAGRLTSRLEGFFTTRHPRVALAVLVVAIALTPLARRVNTDPSLPSYFSDGPIRTGIEAFDRAGGSSPMELVVADAGSQPLDGDEIEDRLQALQRGLERHGDVGSVLSIALLMSEAERPWYSFLFSWETKLEQLDKPEHGRVGRTFISQDRRRARFILRMEEAGRVRPRATVIDEVAGIVRAQGFRTIAVAGLYPLQGELSTLVQGSVLRGLGGLLAAFAVIVLLVTRSMRTALAMIICLAVTPLALFGVVGLSRMPLDIIAAPAANVALPLGIDEMIHLGHRLRHGHKRAGDLWAAWNEALADMWQPILASMVIVVSGFALFLLSDFPPTQRLGVLVCIGAALTDIVVLLMLPALATFRLTSTPK